MTAATPDAPNAPDAAHAVGAQALHPTHRVDLRDRLRSRAYYHLMGDRLNFGYRELMDVWQMGLHAHENGFDVRRAGGDQGAQRAGGDGTAGGRVGGGAPYTDDAFSGGTMQQNGTAVQGYGRTAPDTGHFFVDAGEGDATLLGAHALEGLNVLVDPVGKRLVPGGPLLAPTAILVGRAP